MTAAERNIISGNNIHGVRIIGESADNNIIQGNYVGLNAAGTGAIGNTYNGIMIYSGADNNLVGGTALAARNVISGNLDTGIEIQDSNSTGNRIEGNIIGLNATGTTAIGNLDGVIIEDAPNNTVGGANHRTPQHHLRQHRRQPGQRRGHLRHQCHRQPGPEQFHRHRRHGHAGPRQRRRDGVLISDRGDGGVIKGAASGNTIRNNVISGNDSDGVQIERGASGNVIRGNFVGVTTSGAGSLGNSDGGVYVLNGSNNIIGGTLAGEGNVIAYSGAYDGVQIEAGTGNAILGNSIYANAGLGVELGIGGLVTANDPGDGDTGPNNLQNFPVLTAAMISGSDLLVTGTLNSSISTTFDIDFYASSTADGSGNGEAERYLGSAVVITDSSGNVTINEWLSSVGVTDGEFVTATATDSSGNTSEFSGNTNAVTSPSAPGGVLTDITLWMRADAGVTTGTGGVGQWDNQAANATLPDVQQSTSTKRPDLINSALNFNPVLRFDGTDDALRDSSVLGTDLFAPDAASVFTVVQLNNSGVVFQWEENTNNRVNLEGTFPRFDFGDDVPPDRLEGSGFTAGYHVINLQAAPGSPVNLQIHVDGQLDVQGGASSPTPLNPAVAGQFVFGESGWRRHQR